MFSKQNPYVAGNPIKDQASFFGRQDILREVNYVLTNPQNNAITLYGQRRIGKTSILLQLENALAVEGQFAPVYFDWHAKPSKDLPSMLFELAQTITTATRPRDVEPIRLDPNGAHFREVFLPNIAKSMRHNGLVLLFDEVDTLDEPTSAAIMPYLHELMPSIERVKYVFTLGRRPESLPPDTLSVFKGVRAARVSLLSPNDTVAIVRQSQTAKTLAWEPAALNRVWIWTQGHPYLTQLLCSVVWEQAHQANPPFIPTVHPVQVDAAVAKTLEQGANAFHWIWSGLPPAERIILSTIAEAGVPFVSQEKIDDVLNNSGVRLIVRELKLAPENLVEWELLKAAEQGYQFTVPLLQLWIAANRPLRRVKEELDRLDPLAETLFQASQSFYRLEQLDNSEAQLRQAIRINPNHLGAHLLLGRILLETQRIAESVEILEQAYRFDQNAARPDLIRSLLALVASENDEERQLELYKRILQCDPRQPVAKEQAQKIWLARGERYFKANDLEAALAAFTYAESQPHIDRVRQAQLNEALEFGRQLEATENWPAAHELYVNLRTQYPLAQLEEKIIRCQQQIYLLGLYEKALNALQQEKRSLAAAVLSEIIARQPDYKDAAVHLVRAVRGPVADKPVESLLANPIEPYTPAPLPLAPPVSEEVSAPVIEEIIPAEPTVEPPAVAEEPAAPVVEVLPSFEEPAEMTELFNFLAQGREGVEPSSAAAPEAAPPEPTAVAATPTTPPASVDAPAAPFILDELDTEDTFAAPRATAPPAAGGTSALTPPHTMSAQTRWQLIIASIYGFVGAMLFSVIALIGYALAYFSESVPRASFTQPLGIFFIILFVFLLPALAGTGIALFTFRREAKRQ